MLQLADWQWQVLQEELDAFTGALTIVRGFPRSGRRVGPRLTSFRIPPGVLRATVGGEEVLLNQDTGVYHLVNPTGRSLIRAFESGESLEGAIHSHAIREKASNV
jgi:hypothetical protein